MASPVRHRRCSSAPVALLLAVVVGAVGAFGVIRAANARTSDIQRIEGLELALTSQDGPAENYLLIGSDSRENAGPDDADFGGIGDVNAVPGRRSDTIMILRQEEDGNGASIVSLPRAPLDRHRRSRQPEPNQLGLQRRHRRPRHHDHPGTRYPDPPRRRHRFQRLQGPRRCRRRYRGLLPVPHV